MNNMKASTIMRNDNYDELNVQVKLADEVNALRVENKSLSFMIAKYNTILNEYQMKYGNDLFLTMEKAMDGAVNDNAFNNDVVSLKKKLIENISIFKEYEKIVMEKCELIKGLNDDVAKMQKEFQSAIKENEEIRAQMEKLKSENDEMYRAVLDKKKIEANEEIKEEKNEEKSENEKNVNDNANNNEMKNYYENVINDLNAKYQTVNEQRNEIEDINMKLRNENEELQRQITRMENQIREYNDKIIMHEREKNKMRNEIEKKKINANIEASEKINIKEIFAEIESRKNKQIEVLQSSITEKESEVDAMKSKLKNCEDKLSSLKFEVSQLKQENETIKCDRDHLTKIIEDSSLAVQIADEKEKNIDKIIKSHKTKSDSLLIENEKLNLRIKMQQNQLSKFTNDYTSLIKEKCDQYDNIIALSQSKYENAISALKEENALLKAENTSLKMEKDKFASEYKLAKSELDRINHSFASDNANYISQYEQSEKKYNAMLSQYESKISELNIKLTKLSSEHKANFSELESFRSNEKLREAQFFKMTQNENLLLSQINKIKEQLSFYMKSNEDTLKEKERLIAMYELKLKNLKDENDIKVVTLENTINFQKEQLALVEVKAFDMLKKQEGLTDKFKKEYFKTIEYYENMISYLSGRGTDQNEIIPINNNYEEVE